MPCAVAVCCVRLLLPEAEEAKARGSWPEEVRAKTALLASTSLHCCAFAPPTSSMFGCWLLAWLLNHNSCAGLSWAITLNSAVVHGIHMKLGMFAWRVCLSECDFCSTGEPGQVAGCSHQGPESWHFNFTNFGEDALKFHPSSRIERRHPFN